MGSGTGRSAAIEDFDEEAQDTIEQLVKLTTIPLLRARFADMIWLLGKNYKMAEQAAASYLAAFKAVDDAGHWAYEFDCLKRGMALARVLGTKKQLFLDYVHFVETRLASLETTGTDSLGGVFSISCSNTVMDILTQRRELAKRLAIEWKRPAIHF